MADESTRKADDDLALAPGMAEGAASDDVGGARSVDEREMDDRSPSAGSAEVDADRVRSGVDSDAVGDQGGRSAREALLGDNGIDDDATADQGESVGLADRDADVERSR
jgi:hypothetical protein